MRDWTAVAALLVALAAPAPAPARAEPAEPRSPLVTWIAPSWSRSLASFRLGMGPSWWLGPSSQPTPSFTLDLALGLRVPIAVLGRGGSAGALLWPELGYSYGGASSGHLGTASLGLSLLPTWRIGVTPYCGFVAGSSGGTRALGVRSGLRFELHLGMLIFEAGHQLLMQPGARLSELRLTVGVDVWRLGWAFYQVFTFMGYVNHPELLFRGRHGD